MPAAPEKLLRMACQVDRGVSQLLADLHGEFSPTVVGSMW
mgnify:CR=1 FL=1